MSDSVLCERPHGVREMWLLKRPSLLPKKAFDWSRGGEPPFNLRRYCPHNSPTPPLLYRTHAHTFDHSGRCVAASSLSRRRKRAFPSSTARLHCWRAAFRVLEAARRPPRAASRVLAAAAMRAGVTPRTA
eukprot:scaffold695_cov384-Prasinococcus_capsulatus_cf.AAC.17